MSKSYQDNRYTWRRLVDRSGGAPNRGNHRVKTFRCKIARMVDGFVQTMSYIGPFDRTPDGWSIVTKRPA